MSAHFGSALFRAQFVGTYSLIHRELGRIFLLILVSYKTARFCGYLL